MFPVFLSLLFVLILRGGRFALSLLQAHKLSVVLVRVRDVTTFSLGLLSARHENVREVHDVHLFKEFYYAF